MSIVGPRPHAVTHNEQYRKQVENYMIRHKVKPGITGFAQINGFREIDALYKMEKRVQYDIEYIQNWSLWLDIKLLLKLFSKDLSVRMHTKLIVITGIVISQSAWADLTPKSHIGFAGIDFGAKLLWITVMMIT